MKVKTKKEARVPKKTETIAIEISAPVAEHGQVLLQHLDTKLTARQSKGLRLLFDGLCAEGEKVRLAGLSSSPVKQQADGVRWFLERVADAAGVPD